MNILLAFLCVSLFGLTAPFTRLAAFEVSPLTIIYFRILGAAIVCLIFLFADPWIPPKRAWKSLLATALGSVVGFNSLMAFGLREVPAGHAAVALASLPVVTAIYSSLRDRLNPGLNFWLFAILGTLLSIGFFFSINVGQLLNGDLYLLLAVFSAAFGYVEGGRISREYGGRKTMIWAVLIVVPLIIPLAAFHFVERVSEFSDLSAIGWFSLCYVAVISQSLGMFLWFRVLAKGPMEKVALVQLSQPFLTLFASIVLLNEKVLPITWIIAGLVGACIWGANKGRRRLPIR